ncbi:MAG: nickel-dependent hydrogenase large subunit [Acidobacteria bacterium]|nr:nickel-dependent hydrogenase large subunit [Acidobacteriota bacterium]
MESPAVSDRSAERSDISWHPWNKETILLPSRMNLKERYSWSTAPRWDREPMETGPIARLWISAVFGKKNCEFISGDRRSLEIDIPRGQRPSSRLRWQIPERPNTLERNRARAYQVAYAVWSHTPICSMRSIR